MANNDNHARLLLDASRLIWRRWTGTRATGIDRICEAWINHYRLESQAVIVHRRGAFILPFSTSQALFELLSRPARRRGDANAFRAALSALAIRRWRELRDRLDGRGRLWLNPGHTGLDSARVADWARRRNLSLVPLIHDLIPITCPQYCRSEEDVRHRERMLTALRLARGIVTNSGHTFSELRAFATAGGLQVPPAIAVWPGTPILPPAPRPIGPESTFVVLGTIEGRKNHALLLSVWRKLLKDRPSEDVPKLVIVGRRGWQADDVFAQLDSGDFGDHVAEMGPLDDHKLSDVLSGARALLFPSCAEGYGMPLVEALAAGVPVIASDLPVFREIGQGVPELLPADDFDAWLRAVEDYAKPSSPRRSAQLSRLGGFRIPSWADHFARVDSFLSSLQAGVVAEC